MEWAPAGRALDGDGLRCNSRHIPGAHAAGGDWLFCSQKHVVVLTSSATQTPT